MFRCQSLHGYSLQYYGQTHTLYLILYLNTYLELGFNT